MNKVIDKGFRSCRFVSTIVKHPVQENRLTCNVLVTALLVGVRPDHCWFGKPSVVPIVPRLPVQYVSLAQCASPHNLFACELWFARIS